MVLYVLDTAFKTVQVIDTFQSLIWTRRYSTTGDFELYTAASDDFIEVLKAGYYLVREEDVVVEGEYKNVMIIGDVEVRSNSETGDVLIVTGRDLKSILLRRVVSQQTVLTGTVENCVAKLLNTTIINPSVGARAISNFRLGTNDLRTSYQMEMQVTGEVLEKVISEICSTYGYGYDIYIKDGTFVFYLYEGADRSYSQNENTYVVFSGDFDNLISSDYKINRGSYSNVAYVAGEGEGSDRTIVSVGNAEGLNRYEQWVDARNASSNNGEISVAEYKAMLAQEGSERLSETVVTTKFEGEIDAFTNFVYGEDYFLGDVIQIKNDYGIAARTRIIEVIDSLDEGGREIVVTLSEMVENEVDTTEYLLTETRDIITTEADIGLKAENAETVVRGSSSATPVGYGLRISELPDPSSLEGTFYAALANPDVMTYRVHLPLAKDSAGTLWNGRLITPNAAGYSTDQYGNIQHRRSTNTDTFNIKNNAGTSVLAVNYETGAVDLSSPLAIADGGTGASDRLQALRNLLSDHVSSPNSFFALTNNHATCGWTTLIESRKTLFPTNLSTTAKYLIAITEGWEGGGYVPIGSVRSLIGAKITQLYSGTFKSGSAAVTFSRNYDFYIIYGSSGGGACESVVVPKAVIGTSNITVLISDDETWLSVYLKYSGSTVTMTWRENKKTGGTTWTSGYIGKVYGVNG